jgi:hypothetical protein
MDCFARVSQDTRFNKIDNAIREKLSVNTQVFFLE